MPQPLLLRVSAPVAALSPWKTARRYQKVLIILAKDSLAAPALKCDLHHIIGEAAVANAGLSYIH